MSQLSSMAWLLWDLEYTSHYITTSLNNRFWCQTPQMNKCKYFYLNCWNAISANGFTLYFLTVDLNECRDGGACKTFYKGKCHVWTNTKIVCPKMCGVCTPGKKPASLSAILLTPFSVILWFSTGPILGIITHIFDISLNISTITLNLQNWKCKKITMQLSLQQLQEAPFKRHHSKGANWQECALVLILCNMHYGATVTPLHVKWCYYYFRIKKKAWV